MRLAALIAVLSLLPAPAPAQTPNRFRTVIFGRYSDSISSFEAFARRAKQSGATHIVITAEDLPWALWMLDTPGDPYPAWAMSNIGVFKVATPDALKKYLPQDYADRVMGILKERCEVLRRLGLKAAYTTFEPQILPEQVYLDHPLWRGPQVDHPLRSRVPRFAPNIDNPEVLALYRESMKKFCTLCPEVEVVSLHTNDSGSGMSWSPGLYQGPNGSSLSRDKKMYERYRDFFGALRQGAQDARPGPLEIDAEWVREAVPELFATRLEAGMALANIEGPKATPYKAVAGFLLDYFYPFYPALGIPLPVRYVEELEKASRSNAPRLFYLIGDRYNTDIYFDIYDRFWKTPTSDDVSRMQLLRSIAAARVGEANAGALVSAWNAIHRTGRDADILNFGGTLFYIGGVHQRWITRPFVPFPEELLPEERDYYRKFQFQARGEDRARDLGDIQGTRQYQGLGGAAVSGQLLVRMKQDIAEARSLAARIAASPAAAAQKAELELLDRRLRVFDILIDNCRDGLEYQYLLDFMKGGRLRRPIEFQEHLTDITEWRQIRDIARRQMDNSIVLAEMLESTRDVLIDMAKTKEEENIRVLGPDLAQQLRLRAKIMAKYWEDYERLFDQEKPLPAPAR
ncbi:MAG: hypothetical protein KatS3mg005_2510 [Bryobacteraceae bacterium]|nr:MAG: hypothetical protein KatS3mg005_2510 [Bryobacteraceae bacterium]